jgi:hypothetical protein
MIGFQGIDTAEMLTASYAQTNKQANNSTEFTTNEGKHYYQAEVLHEGVLLLEVRQAVLRLAGRDERLAAARALLAEPPSPTEGVIWTARPR